MKPFVILFALTILQTVCQAQIDFQPGYYIPQPRLGEMIAGGFRYRDRFGIELQYQFPQSTLNNYFYIGSTLTTASLVLSCKIL
jgi:hypothetical protein